MALPFSHNPRKRQISKVSLWPENSSNGWLPFSINLSSIRCATWLWRISWMRIRFTPCLELTLSGEEFIRRFLMHVPPKRFVRIRHYGLLSSRNKNKKITLCRNPLGCEKYISRLKDLDAPAIIKLLYNKDICRCSYCGGNIIPLPSDQYCIQPKPHLLCWKTVIEYF